MTDKITLNQVGSLQDTTTAATTINQNFAIIQEAFDNTFSLDGTIPNQMKNTVDMNSNRMINLPNPISGSEPVTLNQLAEFSGGGTVSPLPPGGTTGQLLSKNSNSDFDVGWENVGSSILGGTNITVTGTGAATVSTVAAPAFNSLTLNGSSSGTMVVQPAATASGVITIPAVTDQLVGRNTTDTLTNKSIVATQLTGTMNATQLPAFTGDVAVSAGTSVTSISTSAVTNAQMASVAPFTLKGNATGSTVAPQDFTIPSLTVKSSPASTDLIIIADQANSGALKSALVSSLASAGSVSSIAGNTGAFTLGNGLTNSTNVILNSGVVTVHNQLFTTSGTYTPTTGMIYCIIECIGAGGGGGGCTSGSGATSCGGGGGGGGYSRLYSVAATIGASQTVTIGAAGASGASGNNAGGTGGATSVGTLCIANGGGAGGGSPSGTTGGGAVGAAVAGGAGTFIQAGNGGAAGVAGAITTINPIGGKGADGPFGGGGRTAGAAGAGQAATGFGAGGSGGSTTGASSAAGGAGFAGAVIITEFCNQ